MQPQSYHCAIISIKYNRLISSSLAASVEQSLQTSILPEINWRYVSSFHMASVGIASFCNRHWSWQCRYWRPIQITDSITCCDTNRYSLSARLYAATSATK